MDVLRHVVYSAVVGSRAFGLANEKSDTDVRGVYLPPARLHWSLTKPPEQVERIRDGKASLAEVKERVAELDAAFRGAFERTKLPEQPDYARVDRFLVQARRSQVR